MGFVLLGKQVYLKTFCPVIGRWDIKPGVSYIETIVHPLSRPAYPVYSPRLELSEHTLGKRKGTSNQFTQVWHKPFSSQGFYHIPEALRYINATARFKPNRLALLLIWNSSDHITTQVYLVCIVKHNKAIHSILPWPIIIPYSDWVTGAD